MTYLPHVSTRKPLYVALALATLSLGYLGTPDVAFAAQTTAQPDAAAPAAQTSDSTNTKKNAKDKKGDTDKSADAKNPTTLQTVVVSSFRQSIDQNMEDKRDSNAIVESINAQNISQFPAKNIADALAHVPGVVISRDAGEGKTVSIRGLAPELTLTELNGNSVASADTSDSLSRSFNYTLFPANMFSDIKLYKSLEARLDEGGIGGVVDLHTRRPLEMQVNDGFISVNAAGADNNSKTKPQVSALWSWHNKSDTFGVLVAGTYQERQDTDEYAQASSWHWWDNNCTSLTSCTSPPLNVHGQQFGSSTEPNIDLWPGGGVTDQAGNSYSGYWMPQQFSTTRSQLDLKTKGAQVTVQFKPTKNFLLTGNYFRFQRQQDQITNTLEIPEWGLPTDTYANQQGNLLAPNGLTFDSSHTIVTGANYALPPAGQGCNSLTNPVTGAQRQAVDVCSSQTPWLNGNYSIEKALSQSFNIEGEWSGEGNLSATFNLGRSWASGGPSVEFGMAAKPRNFVNGQWVDGNQISDWTLNGSKATITASPNVLQNMLAGEGQVDLGSTGSSFINTTAAQNFAQADFTYAFDSNWMQSLQFGFKYRDNRASQDSNEIRWYCKGTTEQFQTCDPNAGNLPANFLLPSSLNGNSQVFSDNVFPAINFPAYYNYLNQTYDRALYPHPGDESYIRESISAAYVQANIDTGTIRGNVGLRFVSTLQNLTIGDMVTTNNAVYYHSPQGQILICPTTGMNIAGGPCAPGDFEYLPQEQAVVETYSNTSTSKRYNKLLPSFNFAWTLADDIVLRAAGSQAMARANYGDLAELGSLTNNTQAYYNDRKQFGAPLPGWYGSGANQDLKPFTATQFDLAGEWYYSPESVVGVDVFQKTVKNFVVPVTINNTTVDVNGTPTPFMQYSTNANGRSGTSRGVEIYTQHTFDMGFGYIANYTLNKTNETSVTLGDTNVGKSELIGSAKYAANVSLFYEKHGLLLRVTSNWTGRTMQGLMAGLPEYMAPYNQIDLNGDYEINKHFMVTASVLNLTRSTSRSYLGSDTTARLNELEYTGRQYYVGVTYKFGDGG